MKSHKLVLFTILSLTVALFMGACADEDEDNGVDFDGLVVASVATGPTIDGSVDAVWSNATEHVVTVGESAEYAYEFGVIDVSLKALQDDEYIYILASWTDHTGTETVDKNQWSYSDGAWSKSGNEDRFFLMFDAGDNGTEGANCATMCHVADGAMSTTGGGHVDVWHWKAARTNPIGLTDDKWWDGTGRGSDAKTISAYKDNKTSSGNFPLYAGPITDGSFIIIPESGSTADLTPFDSTDATLQANTYPGYYLNANAKGSGESRHDVEAGGKYSSGVWTVEFKRSLSTGNNDDVVFVAEETLQVSIAITDNSGGNHSGAPPFNVKF